VGVCYDVVMKYVMALWLLPVAVWASVITTEENEPFELIPIEGNVNEKVTYLGTLDGYPDTFTFTTDATTTVEAVVKYQATVTQGPDLLLVAYEARGGRVREEARTIADMELIARERELGIGLAGKTMTETVPPGEYRLEVSSPTNIGTYTLTIGTDATAGYWETLADVRSIQSHFGYTIFSMLRSSLVYYPLGILLVLFAMFKTWQCRHLLLRQK
jgi:hypothetical protein